MTSSPRTTGTGRLAQAEPDTSGPVLDIHDLHVTIPTGRGPLRAVAGIDWSVSRGETLALVGESGSGKTISVLAAAGLAPPTAEVTGSVTLHGQELTTMPDRELRRLRGRSIGFVFQDPMSTLNPVMRVGRQVSEACVAHLGMSRRKAHDRAVELLDLVGIPSAAERARQYPHQFSGGMRQRVVIAMALACDPDLLIADEPTTALDVTTQAQIIELVADLQQRLHTAVVWITHDLGVVAGIADRVLVMYGGRIVEEGAVDDVFAHPAHPYTRALLAARPHPDRKRGDLPAIAGSPPNPLALPAGCAFWPRCPVRSDPRCESELPPLHEIRPRHLVRTFCEPTEAPPSPRPATGDDHGE